MTFNPMMLKAVSRLLPVSSVCELGTQRFTAGPGTTEEFYARNGVERYDTVDFNSKATIRWDLNETLLSEGFYDLVTNNGTGEHVFNPVFETCHNLCRAGGLILHVLPWLNWINHGFYCFQPKLFRDLARANGYEEVFMFAGDRNGNEVAVDLFSEAPIVAKVNIMLCVSHRKLNGNAFVNPIQGEYVPGGRKLE